jgi:hypothetical protein
MLTTTDETVEVVYTGQLTYACEKPNATDAGEGPSRWRPKNAEGVGTKRDTVVVAVRGMSGRELTKSTGMVSNQVDAVYDVVARVAEIVEDRKDVCLRGTDSLTFPAVQDLWFLSLCLTKGHSYEDKVMERWRAQQQRERVDDDDPEDD